jgi:hypothetical protein
MNRLLSEREYNWQVDDEAGGEVSERKSETKQRSAHTLLSGGEYQQRSIKMNDTYHLSSYPEAVIPLP